MERARAALSPYVDVLVAAALALAAEIVVVLDGLSALDAAAALAATAPFALRRRRPALVVLAAAAAPVVNEALGGDWTEVANAPVFIIVAACFAVAVTAPLRPAALATAAAALLLATAGRADGDGGDEAFLLVLMGLPWACGRAVRAHAAEAAELRALAAALEREREAVAGLTAARERRRMAREVHDAVTDVIADIRRTAVEAEERIGVAPQAARPALERIGREARRAVGELRGILDLLRRDLDPRSRPVREPRSRAPHLRRWPTWSPRRDHALALLVLLAGVIEVALTVSGARDIMVGLAVAAAAAIAVACRRRPLAGLAVALLAATLTIALVTPDVPLVPFLALLVLLFSTGTALPATAAWAAFATTLLAIATADVAAQGGDSADVTLIAALLVVPLASGLAVGAWRAQSAQLAVLAARLEHERDARARLAASEERARLARELHDSVAHALSVIALQADGAGGVLAREPERARAAAHTIAAVADDALGEVRELLGLLDPDDEGRAAPARGTVDAVDAVGALVVRARASGLEVDLRVEGTRAPLPAALDAAAYRLVQEGLTNAVKHAPGARALVTLRYADGGVEVSVVDDGATRASAAPPSGYGLIGMRERVTRLGGDMRSGTRAGGGFELAAFLPDKPAPR